MVYHSLSWGDSLVWTPAVSWGPEEELEQLDRTLKQSVACYLASFQHWWPFLTGISLETRCKSHPITPPSLATKLLLWRLGLMWAAPIQGES